MEQLEQRVTSMELCELINELRVEEKGEEAKVLMHANLIRSIESEIESLKNLEIAGLTRELGAYIDCQNRVQIFCLCLIVSQIVFQQK